MSKTLHLIERTGLANPIGAEHFFPSVRTGVQAFLARKNVSVKEELLENFTMPVQANQPNHQNPVPD